MNPQPKIKESKCLTKQAGISPVLWEIYIGQHLVKVPPASSSSSVLLLEFLLVTELLLFLLFPVL